MKKKFTITFAFWTFFVFAASLIPGNSLPKTDWMSFFQFDKVVHLILYFSMCTLMYLSLVRELRPTWRATSSLLISAIFAIVFGFFMEILQSNLNTGRYFDIFDVLANTIGVAIAVLVIYLKH